MRKTLALLSVVLGLTLGGSASAETWAFTDNGPGTQTGNEPILLANSFTVNAGYTINVDSIGVFINALNQDGSGTPTGTLEAAIVDSNGNVIAGTDTTFTAGTTYTSVNANDIYQAVTQTVTLGAGNYWLEALGYENPDPNGNTFVGNPVPVTDPSGVLSFGSPLSAYTLGGITFGTPATPDGLDGAPQPQYEIGTFSYELAPEPGTLGMFGIGAALGYAILRRGRKSRSAASVA